MKHCKLFEEFIIEKKFEIFPERDIRKYAWLYFLHFVYNGRMLEASWKKDNRMGIRFINAMVDLEKEGYVIKNGEEWNSTDSAEEMIYRVFGNPKTRTSAELYKNPNAGRFDNDDVGRDDYPISQIPMEIFDKKTRTRKKKHDRKLSRDDYWNIRDWFEDFQRGEAEWNSEFNHMVGAVGDLVENKEYTLYRGIYVKDDGEKVGDKILDSGMSWSTSISSAVSFAEGNRHWMDNKEVRSGHIGIILKYKFKPSDIFIDLEWIDKLHPLLGNNVDFNTEYEVIVPPIERKVVIKKVIRPK